jgi:hypothetical protein
VAVSCSELLTSNLKLHTSNRNFPPIYPPGRLAGNRKSPWHGGEWFNHEGHGDDEGEHKEGPDLPLVSAFLH